MKNKDLLNTYISEFILKNLNKSPNTIKSYNIDLEHFKENCKNFLNKESLKDYFDCISTNFKQNTIKRKTNVLKVFYNFLYKNGYIDNNIFFWN